MTQDEQFPRGAPVPGWSGAKPLQRINLEGKHVRLEPLQERHLAPLFEALRMSPVHDWHYMPMGPFAALEEFEAWGHERTSSQDPFFFAILGSDTGEALGFLSYLRIKPQPGSIEIGFIQLATRLQRTTGATEAIYILIRHAFELGYRRVEWKCDSLNARSRRAAGRFGFTFEGVFRQATVVKGRNRDTAWFSITDKEWPELASAYDKWFRRVHSGRDEDYLSLSALTSGNRDRNGAGSTKSEAPQH